MLPTAIACALAWVSKHDFGIRPATTIAAGALIALSALAVIRP